VRLPEICAEQWRERLGLQVYLLPVDEEDFQHRVVAHDYDLILGPIVGTLPDLTHLASELTSSTNSAYSGWDGSAVVKLVERAREADAGQVHNRILAVEKAYLEEMPAAPLIVYNRHTLKSLSVAGWYVDSTGQHPLKYLSLADGPATHDD
jgi:ABC-type oligopeptide transport system substrate-binding subunit